MLALAGPGDEVVMFEPYYDSYAATVALAGARRRVVTLRPATTGWAFDADEFRAAITPRTKVILLNTPHNPTGKVFTRDELTVIATAAAEHDSSSSADEVYEHLTFDGRTHIPIATLPGMAERTVTIGSAGKTFSVTGLEDRLGHGTARARDRGAHRQAVPHLRQRCAVPTCRRRRARRAQLCRHRARRCRSSATGCATG